MKPFFRLRHAIGRHIRQNPQRLLSALVRSGLSIESVIHCGAHHAQERFFYEAIGAKRIVWIEGSRDIFQKLQKILSHDAGAGKLSAEHIALHALLFEADGEAVSLHGFTNEGQSNSIFHATETFARRWPAIGETGKAETHLSSTLDLIAEKHAPKGADLLVLDLQGAELSVMRGGSKTLASAKAVICEVSKIPIYEGGAMHMQVLERLKQAGFEHLHRAPTSGDQLFIRKDLL